MQPVISGLSRIRSRPHRSLCRKKPLPPISSPPLSFTSFSLSFWFSALFFNLLKITMYFSPVDVERAPRPNQRRFNALPRRQKVLLTSSRAHPKYLYIYCGCCMSVPQAVIFLASHDEVGSAGFILNRPTSVQLGDLVEGTALPQFRRSPLYLGGDVGE